VRTIDRQYKTRSYPEFAACGLNCGLCPRYYTKGASRCPGCAAKGFFEVHPSCGILSCCQRKGIEYCFECSEYPCSKYDGVDLSDSFITHRNQFRDMDKAKRIGMEAYKAELGEKIVLLENLLKNYDDGRRKSFYCLAVNLLELSDIKVIIEQIVRETNPCDPIKDKAKIAARLFQNIADERNISLKLRKN
jgi:hypothetical protein